jgi:hypothetical protein
MPAGPKMDGEVHVRVMGQSVGGDPIPPYSTRTPAALAVLQRFSLYEVAALDAGLFRVEIRMDGGIKWVQASAPMLALASCRAALKAVAR